MLRHGWLADLCIRLWNLLSRTRKCLSRQSATRYRGYHGVAAANIAGGTSAEVLEARLLLTDPYGGYGGGAPSYSVTSDSSVTEGDAAVFDIQAQAASGGSLSGITIYWSILPGASPSVDSYDLSWNGSEPVNSTTGEASVSITAIDDLVDEYDENFRVHLTASSPYGSSDLGTYDVVLLDNDAAPTLTLQRFDSGGLPLNNVVPESLGYGGTVGVEFSIIASHATVKPASLQWSTANGTATGIDLSVARCLRLEGLQPGKASH